MDEPNARGSLRQKASSCDVLLVAGIMNYKPHAPS